MHGSHGGKTASRCQGVVPSQVTADVHPADPPLPLADPPTHPVEAVWAGVGARVEALPDVRQADGVLDHLEVVGHLRAGREGGRQAGGQGGAVEDSRGRRGAESLQPDEVGISAQKS